MNTFQRNYSRRAIIAIAAWNVIVLGYIASHLLLLGFLPPQFFQFSTDSFMDFFHSTYWAYHDERYSDWGAIQPPLAFAIAKLTSLNECFLFDGFAARDTCGLPSMYVMWSVALGAAYLNARMFTKDRIDLVLCFVSIATTFPFLHAIERGNLVLFGYAFLVLSVNSKSKLAKGFFLACAVNIKQYLAILLGFTLLRRNYSALISFMVSILVVMTMAALYLPARDYFAFVENMFPYIEAEKIGDSILRVPYSASVNGFISFSATVDAQYFFDALSEWHSFFDTDSIFSYAIALQTLVFALVAIVGVGLLRFHSQTSEAYVSYASLVCLFNLSDATSSYALIFILAYLPKVLPELTRKEHIALFVLFQPFDAMLLEIGTFANEISFISGETVTTLIGFTYGSIFRPMSMIFLLAFIALRLLSTNIASGTAERDAQCSTNPNAA